MREFDLLYMMALAAFSKVSDNPGTVVPTMAEDYAKDGPYPIAAPGTPAYVGPAKAPGGGDHYEPLRTDFTTDAWKRTFQQGNYRPISPYDLTRSGSTQAFAAPDPPSSLIYQRWQPAPELPLVPDANLPDIKPQMSSFLQPGRDFGRSGGSGGRGGLGGGQQ